MGVLAIGFQFSVSFALAFIVAVKSRGVQLRIIRKGILWRYFINKPLDFIRHRHFPKQIDFLSLTLAFQLRNMTPIIECVPNFSEGRDTQVIQLITDEIEKVEGVRLLNVDPGKATNRTVVTFVGNPEAVVEAAFLAIRKAGELIDMRRHQGAHPRMGATDVCPLIPVSGISMEETARWAQKLADRVGKELAIPVYLYEAAQKNTARNNLSVIRAGE